MGIPERTAVGALAFTATSIVVCALFFCGEAAHLERTVKETLLPPAQFGRALDRVSERPPPPPPPCLSAIVDDVDAPLATRAAPESESAPCSWYPRRGLAPVWAVRSDRHTRTSHAPVERPLPVIRTRLDGPRPRPGRHYVAQSGETLPAIAHEAYGRVDRWLDIWLANLELLRGGRLEAEGLELFIPE